MSYDKESLAKSWSYSQAKLFAQCPRKYYYNYVLGKKEKAGVAAEFSSAVIHTALAGLHEGKPSNTVEGLHLEFLRQNGEMLDLDARYSLATARKVISAYLKSPGVTQEDMTSVMYEPRLEVQVGDAVVIVKPDVVFADTQGKYVPLDFKVSGYERNGVDYEYQFIGQCVATQAERYLVDEITVTKAGKISISRHEVMVSEEHKAEWIEETRQMIGQRNEMLRSKVWPKHTWSCYDWGRRCSYADACQAGRTYGEGLL